MGVITDSMFIVPLDSSQADLALAGGKGANLSLLARAGFPVPGGFIVTTDANRTYVERNDLEGFILETLEDAKTADPERLETLSESIRGRFAAGGFPPDLLEVIRSAYLGLDLGSIAVAVRSSATAEDLPGMSFAGQQDTYLNVVGEESVLRAVVDCWSSLWTARAIGYRQRNGVSHRGIALAVIVQSMVQSEASGVLFTADPLTGKRDVIVVDAALGLGEALVSGRVTPDHYVVAAPALHIVEKTLGEKALSIRGETGGGTISVAEHAASKQALPDAAIGELAFLGQRAAELFGAPQDIEWAWVEDRLWLLQSRPITSLYPLPAVKYTASSIMPAEPLQVLLSFGAVQGMLDPITPLGRDAVAVLVAGAVNLFGDSQTYATQSALVEAGERLFLNITGALRHGVARRIVRHIPPVIEPGAVKALDSIMEDPRLTPTSQRVSLRALRRMVPVLLPTALRLAANLLWPDSGRRRTQRALQAMLSTNRARQARLTSLGDTLDFAQQALGAVAHSVTRLWIPALGPGMAGLNLLLRWAGELPDGRRSALEITRGLPYNVTTEMDLALWATAQAIRADAASYACFTENGAAAISACYQHGSLPIPALQAIRAFLERYGMRGVGEIDLGRTRWREDPLPVVQVIQSYLQITDPQQAPDAVFARGAATAQSAEDRLSGMVREQPRGRLKARQVRWAARRVRALAGQRESPKFYIVSCMGLIREALLARGEELVRAGILQRSQDLFFLHLAELEEIARFEMSPAGPAYSALPEEKRRSVARAVAAHREAYDREKRRHQVPRVLLSDGQAFYEGVAEGVGESEGALVGSPVSPGVVEGVVRVVFDPHSTQLLPGEILVCPGTDPAWTPLFLSAKGLVMEVGGLMTHGSVVAREYGIPAVVGVTQATARLKTGQRVRVDGSAGRVVPLDG